MEEVMHLVRVQIDDGKVMSVNDDLTHEMVGRTINEIEVLLKDEGYSPFASLGVEANSQLKNIVKIYMKRGYSVSVPK